MNNDHYVLLRNIEMSDASFLMELNNDLEIARCVVGNPKQVTIQEQEQWMENVKDEKHIKRFIIEYNGERAGTIIVSNIDKQNLTANLNIKLKREARGKGVGKQSIILALEYCFNTLGIYCVTAHVISYNKASLALFESCGFIKEGILRSRVVKNDNRFDLVSFSKTRND